MSVVATRGWARDPINVFVGQGEGVCDTVAGAWKCMIPGGDHSLGCALHSTFSYNGTQYAFSVTPHDPNDACGPPAGDCPNGTNCVIDSALDTLSHEAMEMETDPFSGGWFTDNDTSGGEIADKCNGSYGALSYSSPPGAYWNFHWGSNYYTVQTLFDNATLSCVKTGP